METESANLYPWYIVWSVRNHIWECRDLLPEVSDRIAVYNDMGRVLGLIGLSNTFCADIATVRDKRMIACK